MRLDPAPGPRESGAMKSAEAVAEGQASEANKKKGGVAETTRFLLLLFLFAVVLRSLILAPSFTPAGTLTEKERVRRSLPDPRHVGQGCSTERPLP